MSKTLNLEEFRYWIGRTADFFDSIQAAYGSHLSKADKAVLNKAIGNLKLITLDIPEYFAAYKAGGWKELGITAAEKIGTGIIVAGVAAGTAALLPAGVGIIAGVATGIAAGVALDYGLDLAKNNDLLNRITRDVLDFGKSFADNTDEDWEAGYTRLPEIEVIGYPNRDYDIALEGLKGVLEKFNLAVSDLLSIDNTSDGSKLLQQLGETAAHTGYKKLGEINVAVAKVIKAYNANKKAIDQESPQLAERIQKLQDAMRYADIATGKQSPIVLDLDGDGIETVEYSDHRDPFDFGGAGKIKGHGWLSPDDGFLALDLNDNGEIDGARELFGSRRIDGYTKLEKHDSNNDGQIDSSDDIFSKLLVWQDRNGNHRSEAGELTDLESIGIVSLGVNPSLEDSFDKGNWIPLASSYLDADGERRTMADVYLQIARSGAEEGVVSHRNSYVISGSAGDDVIFGSTKDQLMLGGSGADAFVFGKNSGSDVIIDFHQGRDKIDLRAWKVSSIEELNVARVDGGTSIEHGGNRIFLADVARIKTSDIRFDLVTDGGDVI